MRTPQTQFHRIYSLNSKDTSDSRCPRPLCLGWIFEYTDSWCADDAAPSRFIASGYAVAVVVSTLVYMSFYVIALAWIFLFDWLR